jgi:F-type H+-transporting ATPase subunit b
VVALATVLTGAAALAQTASAPPDHAQPAAAAQAPAGGQASSPSAPPHDEPAHAQAAAGDAHAPAGADHGAAAHEAEAHHEESIWAFLSRIANFVILAGGLVYLLRSPLGKYLGERAEQIKLDLVHAADTRRAATEELSRIEARMKELPAEIDALKARGLTEVQAEQGRIKEAAAAERDRLLEQARREIDQQVAAARRTLKQDAADLVVGIARRRIEQEITEADRSRLVGRYVEQVKTVHD